MLSSHRRIQERQGQSGTPRHEYLQQLVSEYARTPQRLRKEEIVANLTNFAYDPINFPTFHRVNVMALFVDIVREFRDMHPTDNAATIDTERHSSQSDSVSAMSDRLLVEFAMGGICNCIPDPILQGSFIASEGVVEVSTLVESITLDRFTDSESGDWSSAQTNRSDRLRLCELNMALSALTTAYSLLDSPAFADVTSDRLVAHVVVLSGHANRQIANIAMAFLSRQAELLQSITHER